MSRQLAEQVSHLPDHFDATERSTACLLEDLGFPDRRGDVTVSEMEEALKADPELVEKWLDRGTDQRLAGGWGIERENGEYRVQSYSGGECFHVRDRIRACAEFIVHYVRFIGDVQARTR